MQTNTLDPTLDAAPPCGVRAVRALCQRVASLRAALDAVCAAMPAEDALQAPIAGARTELDRFARDVQALIDWSLPNPVRPLECSLEEIGLAAVDALSPSRRQRTVFAVERPHARVVIDGPLASKSLARVLEHGFATGAGHAGLQIEPRDTGFCASASFGGTAEIEDSVAAGLAEPLARRDLVRLGARFDFDVATRQAVVGFFASGPATGGSR
jgi:hypothetical protein